MDHAALDEVGVGVDFAERGDSVFVHLLDWHDRVVSIPPFGARVGRASMLGTGDRVGIAQTEAAITLTMATPVSGEVDRIIVLETRRP